MPTAGSRLLEFAQESGQYQQYKLFHDTNATPFVGNSILAKSFNGSSCIWWERTAVPNVSDEFRCVNAAGHSTDRKKANDSYAVVAGFCL